MPNIWTHNLFAEQVAKRSEIDVSQHKSFFLLGAQGPDPFFYHHFWPWEKKHSMEWLGSKLHKEHCGLFLMKMIDYVKDRNDHLLKHYVLGFISHHLLDRNAHPYIIYKSGDNNKRHTKLEVWIDTLMVQDFYGIDTWKTPVYPYIYVGEKLPSNVSEMLSVLIREIHQVDIPHLEQVIQQAYIDMIHALKFLFDPYGIKNKVLGELVRSYSYSKDVPHVDLLNTERLEWIHPTAESEKSRASFHDIWEKAVEEGVLVFQAINRYLNGEIDSTGVEQLIGDISYETGKPCSAPGEIQFFDPIIT